MKLYGGIDLHSNNCVINLIDDNGTLVLKMRITNSLELMVMLLELHCETLVGFIVESIYNWYWRVDGLMDAGFKVHLANTEAIQQYSELKYGDDMSIAICLLFLA